METYDSKGVRRRLAMVVAHLRVDGVEQKELAERVGLSETHFSAIKNGRHPLRAQHAMAIEREFGIRAAWLLHGEPPVAVAGAGDGDALTVMELPPAEAPRERFVVSGTIPGMAEVVWVRVPKCGRCRGQVEPGATACPHCGVVLTWPAE